jgi:hypothetical protein
LNFSIFQQKYHEISIKQNGTGTIKKSPKNPRRYRRGNTEKHPKFLKNRPMQAERK